MEPIQTSKTKDPVFEYREGLPEHEWGSQRRLVSGLPAGFAASGWRRPSPTHAACTVERGARRARRAAYPRRGRRRPSGGTEDGALASAASARGSGGGSAGAASIPLRLSARRAAPRRRDATGRDAPPPHPPPPPARGGGRGGAVRRLRLPAAQPLASHASGGVRVTAALSCDTHVLLTRPSPSCPPRTASTQPPTYTRPV
ncbi:uncharacterized protein LOC126188504 [Schistocerca cancellata]|uniref:uncharacterized protein LOC126188504 n=1 Tax=Schistocerca cancellata TaxID=274614 RepID=UPI00211801EF|nr:uncharacterized protein LOC126188504 [Schistocerca cancellata]